MREQMEIFKDVDPLRDLSDGSRRYLLDLKQQYLRRRDAVKRLLGPLSSAYDRLKNSPKTPLRSTRRIFSLFGTMMEI